MRVRYVFQISFSYFTCFRCSGCEAVLQGIESQISKANQNKENNLKMKQKIDIEVQYNTINTILYF